MVSPERLHALSQALDSCDAVVVGAGAGLSASAGFDYAGKRFRESFSDFAEKYGFSDMYTGGFYPYETPEEFWAYWSRYIFLNRYRDPPKPVYQRLFGLVRDREYFVVTTNVDHCFQKAGFEKARLFYTQGDYGLLQCALPCHQKTYDNEALIRRMVSEQRDMRVPSELLPRCPVCGRPMTVNLRSDDRFAEDAGWHAAAARYEAFLEKFSGRAVLFLELGVGGNTPGIIKFPFWRMAAANPRATYACVNLEEAWCPPQLGSRAVLIEGDIGEVLDRL